MTPAGLQDRNIIRNFIIRHPAKGVTALGVFCFLFAIIYRPLDTHPGHNLGYEATMAAYCIVISIAAYLGILALKRVPYFSDQVRWTILREISSIFIILFIMGVAAFLAAFAIEPPADRWNLHTFINSLYLTFLAGIIPFAFFSLINIGLWIPSEYVPDDAPDDIKADKPLPIESRLKKEKLELNPENIVYAESDGNYVIFHTEKDGIVHRSIIRNSISDIEKQLSGYIFLFRTHRAFIVNLRKVRMKKGNSLGYRIKLFGVDNEIPVSRNKTHLFNQLMESK